MSSLTLLQVCQAAAEEVVFTSPSSIIGNSDADAVLLLRITTGVCEELVKQYNWQALKKCYTFTTTSGSNSYSMPSDYQKPINLTFWNGTTFTPMVVATDKDWAELQHGVSVAGLTFWYQRRANSLKLHPTPTNSNTSISFDYVSSSYCTDSVGVAKTAFTADTDIVTLDGDLVTRGVKWKFAERKGLPSTRYGQEYLLMIESLQYDDVPRGIINVGGFGRVTDNLPETGYGQ